MKKPVEWEFHNDTHDKVTPYSSSVYTFYSFKKTYYISSLAIHPTRSQQFTNILKHNIHYNIIDIHNAL